MRLRRAPRRAPRRSRLKVRKEAEHIQKLAVRGDARIVKARSIILFSTHSGDAWALDPEDNLARCLARDHQTFPVAIKETGTSFEVEWTARYKCEGDKFTFLSPDGSVQSVSGYPLDEIQRFTALIKRELLVTKPKKPDESKPAGKVGRNDPCPCGSGKKFKKCCLLTAESKSAAATAAAPATLPSTAVVNPTPA